MPRSLAGCLKEVVTICIAVLVFQDVITPTNGIGLALVIFGSLLYKLSKSLSSSPAAHGHVAQGGYTFEKIASSPSKPPGGVSSPRPSTSAAGDLELQALARTPSLANEAMAQGVASAMVPSKTGHSGHQRGTTIVLSAPK